MTLIAQDYYIMNGIQNEKATFTDCKHVNLILWRTVNQKTDQTICDPNSGAFVVKFIRTLFFY